LQDVYIQKIPRGRVSANVLGEKYEIGGEGKKEGGAKGKEESQKIPVQGKLK
jgi:hypothetical protein